MLQVFTYGFQKSKSRLLLCINLAHVLVLLLTPKNGSLPHLPHYMAHLSIFPPYFHQKTHKTMQKASKRLKIPPKGHKTLFSSKNIQNSSKKAKISKKEYKI